MASSFGSDPGKNSPFLISLKRETKAAFTAHGVKQHMVADHLGVANSTVCKWLNYLEPDWPGWDTWMEMAEYVRLIWGTVDHIRPIVRWFGMDLIGNPDSPEFRLDPKTLGRLAAVLASKSGKVLACLVQIIEDGKIDPEEEAQLRDLGPEMQTLMLAVQDLNERCKAQRAAMAQRPA